jgi:N-acylneuraminate cytidylyltransferase/CMP-N,N'-diacetyllegionaminic acid synthase
MYRGKTFLCVLASRGNSKRLPGKNTKFFNGKQLILHTVSAVNDSGVFDTKLLTTDCQYTKDIVTAQKAGWVIANRPAEQASDEAIIYDVVAQIAQEHPGYDYIMLVSPTNPLRTWTDIQKACDIIIDQDCDAVVSISPCTPKEYHGHIKKDGSISILAKSNFGKRVQDFDPCYKLSGAIYLAKRELWRDRRNFWEYKVYPIILENDIEIDTQRDFDIAEALERKLV